MTQVASLTASLELNSASFTSSAEKARRSMAQTAASIRRDTESMSASLGGIEQAAAGVTAKFEALQRLAAVGIAVGAARKALELGAAIATAGDRAAALRARLQEITGEARAFDLVRQSADKLGSTVDAVAGVFGRFAMAGKDLGLTTRETQRLTEVVMQLGRIGGGSAQEFEAAAQQLAQALASGKFQGDELRSVLENAPALARTLADELGVSIGQLREMGTAGTLTADVVARALLGAADRVQERFQKLPETLEQSQARWSNAWSAVLAGLDERLHASDIWKFSLGAATSRLEQTALALGSADPSTATRALEAQLKELQEERAAAEGALGGILGDGARAALGGLLPGLGAVLTEGVRPLEVINAELAQTELRLGEIKLQSLALPDPLVPPTSADIKAQLEGPRAAPEILPLDDIGPARFDLLPDSADLKAQIAATERAEAEKTRIEEQAARDREAKRKAAASAAKAARDREASEATALIRQSETAQETFNRKIAEAEKLRSKQLLTEGQFARVVAREELARASENTGATRERQELEREAASIYASTRTAAEAYAAEIERLNSLHKQGLLDTDTHSRAVAQAGEGMAAEQRRLAEEAARRRQEEERARERDLEHRLANPVTAGEGLASGLADIAREAETLGTIMREGVVGSFDLAADAITSFALTGKADIGDMAAAVLEDMARMAVKMMLFQTLSAGFGGFGGLIGGLMGGGAANSQAGAAPVWAAKGAVFAGPGIQDFENTIVDRPTAFLFARGGALGVMGEGSRKEGVLPLGKTRSGDLGVQIADDGGGYGGAAVVPVEFHLHDMRGANAPAIEQRESQGANGGRRVDMYIRERTDANLAQGRHTKTLSSAFGLRNRPVK